MEVKLNSLWRNNKNEHVYKILNKVVNATNLADGQDMVTYQRVGEETKYVREISEFLIKFTKVNDEIGISEREKMMIFALRYALPRNTIAPMIVSDYIKSYIEIGSRCFLEKVLSEVKERVKRGETDPTELIWKALENKVRETISSSESTALRKPEKRDYHLLKPICVIDSYSVWTAGIQLYMKGMEVDKKLLEKLVEAPTKEKSKLGIDAQGSNMGLVSHKEIGNLISVMHWDEKAIVVMAEGDK